MGNDFRLLQLKNLWILCAVLGAAFITVTGRAMGAVQFKPFDLNMIALSLAPLFVVALLIERTIEVFFGMWREPGDREAEAGAPQEVRDKIAKGFRAETVDPELAKRKAENTRIAFVTNAILSLGVALAGVRILALLIEPCQPVWGDCTDKGNLSAAPGLWQFTDVILTAGILAGGASGFHQVTQLLNSYMKSARSDPAGPQ